MGQLSLFDCLKNSYKVSVSNSKITVEAKCVQNLNKERSQQSPAYHIQSDKDERREKLNLINYRKYNKWTVFYTALF